MDDQRKSKAQLINELVALHQGMAKPEELDAERKRVEGRLDKEFAAITSVVDDMLRGEIDDKETEKRVLDACLTATDSAYGQIGVINKHGKYDTTAYSGQALQDCAFPEALAWEMSTGMTIRGIWGWPMLHGEPLLCNDLPSHPDSVGFPKGHAPLQCFLGVPLKRDEEVVGMVAVANKPGGYTEADKATLIRLASVISVSKQHRLALAALEERTKELKTMVNAMAGREVRMAELKDVIKQLHKQLDEAGMTPAADDPLAGDRMAEEE